jgi:hypothetical protein
MPEAFAQSANSRLGFWFAYLPCGERQHAESFNFPPALDFRLRAGASITEASGVLRTGLGDGGACPGAEGTSPRMRQGRRI